MNDELIKKYSPRIKDAIDYIEGRRNVSPKRQWTPEQRKRWILRSLECPLCNEKYSNANPLTKEHIHPTFLGGYERESNIIPLCKKCNLARNTVMIALLGTPKINNIKNRWPAIKPSLQIFIIWCHASINGDEDALNQCPGLNLAFSQERKITFPSYEVQTTVQPKKKLSLWKRAETVGRKTMISANKTFKSLKPSIKNHQEKTGGLEKIVLGCQGQGCGQQIRIPSEYTGNFRCPKCKHSHSGRGSISKTSKKSVKENTKSKSNQKTENTLPIEDFQRIILEHLEFDPILGAALALKINKYMETKGYEKCNATEFLKLFGLPKGFKKAIEQHLGDLVVITMDGAKYSLTKAKPTAKAKPIPGFSAAGKGGKPSLSMPADCRKVCEMLIFIESKRNICTNWAELLELMITSKIESKKRTMPVYRFYRRGVDQMVDEIDWSQIGESQVVAGLIQENTLQYFSQTEAIKKNNTDVNRQMINDYFDEVKEILSRLEVKNTPKDLNNNPLQKQVQEEPLGHKIVAFRTKILDLLISEESPMSLPDLNKKIIIYMNSIGYESSHVTEFLKLFNLPRGIKKAIEKHMEEEITIVGKAPDWMLKKNS